VVAQMLVNVSQRSTDWLNEHPEEAAEIVVRQLQVAGELEITPEVILRSMGRLDYTTDIDPMMVQETIDYIAKLGYIKNSFNAENILDLRFLEGE
jgi:NitT/TauT family transport system substrate-binding protein